MKSPNNTIELKSLNGIDDEDLEQSQKPFQKQPISQRSLFFSATIALVLFSILSLLIVIVFASIFIIIIVTSSTIIPSSDPSSLFLNRTLIKQRIENYTKTILQFGTRVPGEQGNFQTQQFIKQIFTSEHWILEEDSFQVDTTNKIGRVSPFTNIIATLNVTNVQQRKRIILAAHFDSKLFSNFKFLGASDSVASCAMLLHMSELFLLYKSYIESSPFTIQFVFFDGEEAYVNWSQDDSLYGSRHLAQKWQTQQLLNNIEVFILLDLIGCNAPMPQFYDLSTHNQIGSSYYQSIVQMERNRTIQSKYYQQHTYFQSNRFHSFIDDDHRPFYERGVSIVHLIPIPFPNVWHTQQDDESALDYQVTTDVFFLLFTSLLKQFGFQF